MSEVKRYDPMGYDKMSGYMQEHPEGDYVSASDYDALRAELDAANIAYRIRGDVITEKNAELAALRQPVAGERGALERQAAVNELYAIISGPGDLHAAARRAHDAGYRAALSAPAAGQDVSALVEALEHARQFIRNGVELGYIQMPDVDTPDPAHDTLPKIDAALAAHKAGGGKS